MQRKFRPFAPAILKEFSERTESNQSSYYMY